MKEKKILKIIGEYEFGEESWDQIELVTKDNIDKTLVYCTELFNTTEDSVFNRSAHSSQSFINFAKNLFTEADLDFNDYFIVEDEIKKDY